MFGKTNSLIILFLVFTVFFSFIFVPYSSYGAGPENAKKIVKSNINTAPASNVKHKNYSTAAGPVGFGFCGGMPSAGQALSKNQKSKALHILKSVGTDSIKNNCMGCHAMVSLVSSMEPAQRVKWFRGIKYLREVITEMKEN